MNTPEQFPVHEDDRTHHQSETVLPQRDIGGGMEIVEAAHPLLTRVPDILTEHKHKFRIQSIGSMLLRSDTGFTGDEYWFYMNHPLHVVQYEIEGTTNYPARHQAEVQTADITMSDELGYRHAVLSMRTSEERERIFQLKQAPATNPDAKYGVDVNELSEEAAASLVRSIVTQSQSADEPPTEPAIIDHHLVQLYKNSPQAWIRRHGTYLLHSEYQGYRVRMDLLDENVGSHHEEVDWMSFIGCTAVRQYGMGVRATVETLVTSASEKTDLVAYLSAKLQIPEGLNVDTKNRNLLIKHAIRPFVEQDRYFDFIGRAMNQIQNGPSG